MCLHRVSHAGAVIWACECACWGADLRALLCSDAGAVVWAFLLSAVWCLGM